VIEIDGEEHLLGRYDGIEVYAGEIHQLCNRGEEPVRFLLVSRPNSFNDRVVME
jgi:mannose-6-phosphate isomerase-like protein (cupin superfamily)